MFLAPIPQREKPQPSALCTSTAVELASSPRKRCFSGIFCGAMFAIFCYVILHHVSIYYLKGVTINVSAQAAVKH